MGKKTEFGGCDMATFPETEGLEYSKVCGRIKAYQFGTPSIFNGVSVFANDRRIWSFKAGITQSQADTSLNNERCPCDGGAPFFGEISEIHFCESLIKDDTPGNKYEKHFFSSNVLWDNVGCSSSGDCCSRFVGPYFIRHLESTSTDPIIVLLCSNNKTFENYAIELIEIYIQ